MVSKKVSIWGIQVEVKLASRATVIIVRSILIVYFISIFKLILFIFAILRADDDVDDHIGIVDTGEPSQRTFRTSIDMHACILSILPSDLIMQSKRTWQLQHGLCLSGGAEAEGYLSQQMTV